MQAQSLSIIFSHCGSGFNAIADTLKDFEVGEQDAHGELKIEHSLLHNLPVARTVRANTNDNTSVSEFLKLAGNGAYRKTSHG